MGAIDVEPSGTTLAARVTGVDLRLPLADSDWSVIEAAFHAHAVLIFPEQHLDDAQQIAFSERFGPLERLISERLGRPEIAAISNLDRKCSVVPEGHKLDLLLKGNTFWHTDSSFKRVPAKASLLSARALPSAGGETEFADMRAAYEALDGAARTRLEGLAAIHDYHYSQGLIGGLDVLSGEEWAALPAVPHPVVRIHPATRRASLYIGRHAKEVVGMGESEGRALLEELLTFACRPPRVYLHCWEVGDLVLWDNRCVLHRGHEWDRREPRVMHRTTVAGEGDNEWAISARSWPRRR